MSVVVIRLLISQSEPAKQSPGQAYSLWSVRCNQRNHMYIENKAIRQKWDLKTKTPIKPENLLVEHCFLHAIISIRSLRGPALCLYIERYWGREREKTKSEKKRRIREMERKRENKKQKKGKSQFASKQKDYVSGVHSSVWIYTQYRVLLNIAYNIFQKINVQKCINETKE